MVDTIITELCVFQFMPDGSGGKKIVLTELAPGVTEDDVRAKTEAEFEVSPDLCEMLQ